MDPHDRDERPDLLRHVDDVRRACVEADGQDPLDEAADLRLRHHGLAGTAAEVRPEGFALLRDGELDLAVRPDARGAGHGTALAAAVVPARGPVTAWSHGDHPAAARLAQRHGLEHARELWVMRRPAGDPPPLPEPPPGVRVRGFHPDDDADVAALLAVNAAAFAHHPEQGDLDREGLAERMAEPWFEPEGLLMAVAESEGAADRLLAFHWTKRRDEHTGEVYVVGVDPAAHGQGLGRLVTAAGLRHLARRGVDEVLLYVESDNAAAVALYRGLGFTHAASDTHVQYRRT